MSDLETSLADSLYQGYIKTQNNANERLYSNDNLKVPAKFNFRNVNSLSHEMIDRLQRSQPLTFGELRKIPGLTPAAISTVLVHLIGNK